MGERPGRIDAAGAAALIRPRDTVLCGLATGQATAILEAIGERTDLEEVVVYGGLLTRPYAWLTRPGVRTVSGFFGPIERMARGAGGRVEYLPADFHGLERLALRMKPRVVLAATSPPDADGYLSFGLHAGATFRAFLEAADDPERLAIAEVSPAMPRIVGFPELGGNRVHRSRVDAWVESEVEPVILPVEEPTAADVAIIERVLSLIEAGSTLQFGIGAVPDGVARRLADGPLGDFGIHSEMLSDGVMRLHQAGKVTNRKGLYDAVSVGTFALGSGELYRWLDGNASVRMLPVSAVNEPALLRALRRLVSVNGALAIDLAGQIAADHVGGRQYSGVGGHESFVIGASEAPGGKSIVCLRSTAEPGGKRVSTIVPRLSESFTVTTARHHVQWVVTENGAVDLSVLSDVERRGALVEIAHPDFREELRKAI